MRVIVVMPELRDHVQAYAAMGGDRGIECGIKARNEWLEIGPFAAGPQADTRTITGRRDMSHIGVNAEIDPHALEISLYRLDDAAFPGTRRTVENDDLAVWLAFAEWHESNPFGMLSGPMTPISELFDWTDAVIAVTDDDRGEVGILARNSRPIETEL